MHTELQQIHDALLSDWYRYGKPVPYEEYKELAEEHNETLNSDNEEVIALADENDRLRDILESHDLLHLLET